MLINDYINIAQLAIRSSEPVNHQTTISNRDVVGKLTSQKWVFQVTTTKMNEIEYMALMSVIASQSGSFGEFQFKCPIGNYNPHKDNMSVSVAALAGDSVISINPHGEVYPGTFVKFGGHSKVYQILLSTTESITIFPDLVSNVAIGEAVIVDQPIVTVRNSGDMSPISISNSNIAQEYDFTLVEVL